MHKLHCTLVFCSFIPFIGVCPCHCQLSFNFIFSNLHHLTSNALLYYVRSVLHIYIMDYHHLWTGIVYDDNGVYITTIVSFHREKVLQVDMSGNISYISLVVLLFILRVNIKKLSLLFIFKAAKVLKHFRARHKSFLLSQSLKSSDNHRKNFPTGAQPLIPAHAAEHINYGSYSNS